MIKILLVFFLIMLLLGFAYHSVSQFTLREYKLAFKIGVLAAASVLVVFFISQF